MVRTAEVTATGNPEPAVRLTRLTKSFGPRRGIRDVDLKVKPHQVFGFLGPNGAGKSTTIRLMLGLYRPTSGTALVLGHDARHAPVELLRRIGYLPGELNLPGRMTGREIVNLFAAARKITDSRLRHELVDRFRLDLDRPVRMLSKGNRQKIGLLLAFQHRPELLVLDEPTSGLDPLLQDEFACLVRDTVAEGRTVFLSSHDLDEVQRLVHQLAIIRDGKVVVTDTVAGLRESSARVLEFRFPGHVDPAEFAVQPGVRVRSSDGDRLVLSLAGAVAPVLALAARRGAVDIVARPADLDELFRSYYDDRGGERIHDVG